ncbi:nucleoside diphosphate kinase homolog 7-like isoform X2 [Littorina saxatilis]|uniref:DM10 domain-containing protein n=1 Tax=Littorina saxatilis TaxID=31220 RepID=A0AAN9ANF4_9CAEN
MDDERYCFTVEWYEEMAARVRQFQFFYFVKAQSIEMYDIKNRKMFLRTSVKENNISPADLYLGNSINVCGRLLNIVDYGDDYTRRKLSAKKERTLGMIKPDAVDKLGQILDKICQKGFLISRLRMCRMNRNQALSFYQEHQSKPFLNALLDYVTSGPVVTFEIVGENAVGAWREAIGPTDPSAARKTAPTSIRAQYGQDVTFNAVHGSSDPGAAAREIEFFFPSSGPVPPNTARVGNCTCCIIKPSAVKAGMAGKIISAITEAGFQVGATQMFTLEKANAEEFLEVYKGVVHEYSAMVVELTSGPCLVLEICAPEGSPPVAPAFRELAGPTDPEIARHLRPRTLRALFGSDKIKNAIHCTDLPDDGQLEVEYFFRILDR